jgi:hypothetical protein
LGRVLEKPILWDRDLSIRVRGVLKIEMYIKRVYPAGSLTTKLINSIGSFPAGVMQKPVTVVLLSASVISDWCSFADNIYLQ